MRFRVTGAIRETGSDIKITIEAADFADAERIAQSKGILVSEVTPDSTAAILPNLTICPACGKTISKQAPTCVGCGQPMIELASMPSPSAPQPPLQKGDIICPNPNCGFRGKPNMIVKANATVGRALILSWIISLGLSVLAASQGIYGGGDFGWLFAVLFVVWLIWEILNFGMVQSCPRCRSRIPS